MNLEAWIAALWAECNARGCVRDSQTGRWIRHTPWCPNTKEKLLKRVDAMRSRPDPGTER